ncbi:MAG: SbcC/MukB-like Walker B domain-containing protein [Bacilli bacterium]|nr:SbcC/MukB-like Walker B domain-containing protein [Bacilli bacterium]
MKSLSKLRLINWHLFSNETVDIKNITFLTGANGTGKSTIIDAIQIILLGDTSGRNFNKAANDRTGRTLKGYLRCETGETKEGQVMCLRPGRFTSYIALEITDDKTQKVFTLGIVFDCFDDDSETHHFFYLNSAFPSNKFTNSELLDNEMPRPLTYKELMQVFSDSYKSSEYKFFETNILYQQFISEKLGNLPDKYFSLFKKAVSFSPITNISSFITEFVCDVDYNIDIAPMRTNIEQYKLLELEAKKIQTKIDSLEKIKSAYNEFQDVKDGLKLADYVANRANYETYKLELDKYKERYENNKIRIAEIVNSLHENDVETADLRSEKESYFAKKIGSAGFSLSTALANKKEKITERLTHLENNYQYISETLTNLADDYLVKLSSLSNRLAQIDVAFLSEEENDLLEEFKDESSEFIELAENVKKKLTSHDIKGEDITEFQSAMNTLHFTSIKMVHMLENSVYSLGSKRDAIDSEISQINAGHKPFNQTYLQVRSSLQAQLRESHSFATVSTYCDLVDITESRWTNAIEAFIYNQKFNLFVENEYYEEASKLLARICKEYGFYYVSIIDAEKLISKNFIADDGSVAEVIKTKHKGAQAYTNFLLGRVKRCETFSEARNSGNGLLPNCTGYRSYASFYLNQRKADVSYIGTKLDQATTLAKKNEFSKINNQLEKYNDILNYFSQIAKLEVLNSSQCHTFVSDVDEGVKVDELNEQIARLNEQMDEGDLSEVAAYDEKIASIDEDIKTLATEKENLLVEKGGLENQNKSLKEELIPAKNASLTFMGEKLLDYDPKMVEEKYAPFFDNAAENLPLKQIKQQAQSHYVQTQNKMKNYKAKLMDLRSKYVASYNLSYDITLEDDNSDFDKELDNLSQVLLPSYLEKIESAHKKAIEEFKDDFIFKLRTSFEKISTQIDELNQALESVKFGRDSYKFSVEPNKDYLDYYNMIMDDLLLNIGDSENEYLEKYSEVMNNLFSMISESTDSRGDVRSQIAENIEKFTDYRTYLVFDLLVKRGDNNASSLARTFKRQSGGETQTPFYISILASFAQLYRTNEPNSDSIRLVIFDEAFSKMDGARIKEAVGLLRSFGLQAILSTPSEKLRDLSSEVDLVLVSIHDNKKNRSYIDRYEEVK